VAADEHSRSGRKTVGLATTDRDGQTVLMLPRERGGEPARLIRSAGQLLVLIALAFTAGGAGFAWSGPATPSVAPQAGQTALPFELTSLAHESLAAQIAYFSGPGRRQAAALISRVGTLRPELEAALDSVGAPHELVWVAALESGFDPRAGSRSGAAGVWQFIPVAADGFDLAHNGRVDERRHIRASTEAAGRLLTDLRRDFGSWPLALAAYNMGPYGVRGLLAGQTPTDFWTFERNGLLPGSVRRYAAKILALAVVASNPERYGLSGLQTARPREVAEFAIPSEMTLTELARGAGTTPQAIRTLNPWLIGTLLLPGDTVYLPPASLEPLRIAALKAVGSAGLRTVSTRFGEELDDLAARFGVRPEQLRQLNGWPRGFEPAYESELLVPATATERAASSERPVVVLPALPFSFPDRARWFYRVNRHDELETLAVRLGLPAADLALWNDLDPKLPLRVASMLTVWLPAAFVSEGIQLWPESAVEIARPDAAAASAAPKRARASEPKRARHTRRSHAVKAGETLSSIARRFRVRVADLRRWNDLDEDEIILVGQPLLVGR